jgi:hypothetical protein
MINKNCQTDLLQEVLSRLKVVNGPDKNGNFVAWCVFHPDGKGKPPHQPNLYISEKGFICHACGEKGSLKMLSEHLGFSRKRSDPEQIYSYRDEGGELLYQVLRYPGKEFPVRRPDDNGGWIWNLNGTKRVLYRLPELISKGDETVFIVEGEKDVDKLTHLGLLATTNPGGAGKWRAEYNDFFEGRDVVIIPDNDQHGENHAAQIANNLQRMAISIRILRLPGLREKGDVSDWLQMGNTLDDLVRLSEFALVIDDPINTNSSEKSVVKYTVNRDKITSIFSRVIEVIKSVDRFFVYGNGLVYVQPGLGVIYLNSENLNGYLLNYLEIKNVSLNSNGAERLLNYQVIARNQINMFLSSPEIKAALPDLKSYSRIPIFDEKWNLINRPGYHAEQGIFYDGPIIDPRSRTSAIDEMLREVHWKDASDRANFIGVLLTGLTIDRWIGTHPLVALNGNKSQVGKSTLARILGIILGGCIPSSIGYTPNQAEFEKAIAMEVDKGGPVVFIDNAKGSTTSAIVNSPVLERCITDRILNFRRLGVNKPITRRNDVIFVTTMNDSKFSRDLQNRDIPINLEVFERVQDLKYSITDLDRWVLEHRLDIISEVLGMILKWVDLECPVYSEAKHTVGPEWAKTIDSILKTNGITGFLANYEESNMEYDADRDLMVEICDKYKDNDFMSPGDWANLLNDNLLKERLSDHRGNLRSERSQVVTVGKLFGNYEGEKISCDSGDYTVERKLVKSRPKKHAYRFKKIEKSSHGHDA